MLGYGRCREGQLFREYNQGGGTEKGRLPARSGGGDRARRARREGLCRRGRTRRPGPLAERGDFAPRRIPGRGPWTDGEARELRRAMHTGEGFMATRYALTVGGAALAAGLLAGAQAGEAVRPEKVIRLFNGKDFTGLYTWVKGSGREDPARVFTV